MDVALYPRLTFVRVEESVLLPDAFELRLEDSHFRLLDTGPFTLGTRIEIAMRAEGGPICVTSGEVTAIGVEPGVSGRHEIVVSGFDLTHRLARTPQRRSFHAMTDADIATQIAEQYSLHTDIAATGAVREHVMQANETDYAFLKRRASRIGFDFWITGSTFHYAPQPSGSGTSPRLRWGENLHRFSVRFSASDRCDEVVVRGWDALAKRAVLGTATEGDRGTDAPGAAEFAQAARNAFGRIRRVASQYPVVDQIEADALASSLMLRTSGGEVLAHGEADGNPRISAGAEVQIEGTGSRLTGTYRVTSVEHVFGSGRPYTTRFVCGGKEPQTLVDLLVERGPGAVGGRGAAGAGGQGLPGLAIGQVTNNDDPEHLGRVKVRFPTLTEDHESTWARVASPGGGAERGMQWIPEVGDEVLVGFELADHTRPIVLGGLWNRADQPPEPHAVAGDAVAERLLTSRSGHSLRFSDEHPKRIVLTHGGCESALTLEEESSRLEAARSLDVAAQDITVTARGELLLDAAKIRIKASGIIEINGRQIKLN